VSSAVSEQNENISVTVADGSADVPPWRIIIALLAVAAAVRLYVLLNTAVIAIDGVEYIRVARLYGSFRFTEALGQSYPPMYPALIALFQLPGLPWELAGQLVSLTAGVLALFPIFFLVRSIYDSAGSRVALLACLLLAFQPEMARYSGQVRSESTYILFAVCAVFFGWRAISSGRGRFFALSGLFATFAYLTRPEGLGFLLLMCAWVVLGLPKRYRLPWKRRFAGIGIALLPTVMVAGSYVTYITVARASHEEPLGVRLSLKRNVSSLLRGDYISEEYRPDEESLPETLSFAVPVLGWLRSYAELTGRLLCKNLYPLLSLLLLLALLRRRENPRDGPFELFILITVIFYIGVFSFVRVCHRLPVQLVAPLLFLPALGFFELTALVRDRFKLSPKAFRRLSAVILLVLLAAMTQQFLAPERIKRQGVKLCGQWIKKNHAGPNPSIATDLMRVVFYADGAHAGLPARFLDRKKKLIEKQALRQMIAERNADFLALDADTVSKEDMEHLRSHPQLEFIDIFKPVSVEGRKVALFRVSKASERSR
jgi:hypothetical protein